MQAEDDLRDLPDVLADDEDFTDGFTAADALGDVGDVLEVQGDATLYGR